MNKTQSEGRRTMNEIQKIKRKISILEKLRPYIKDKKLRRELGEALSSIRFVLLLIRLRRKHNL
jgi:hypothetical protein